MKISIAMATYRGATYLPEQLASFAAQTRLPEELVITDDCSPDDTVAVLETFAATAPFPVRIERNPENLGFAQNFSRVLSLASGDLVFLSDQDDTWMPEKLARMAALAEAHPDKACFMNDAFLADGDMVPNGQTKIGQIRAVGLAPETFVMGCCAALRQGLLEIALPVPPGFTHDSWIVQISDRLGLTLRIEEPLQHYRLHGDNASDFFVNSPQAMSRGTAFTHRLRKKLRRLTAASGLGEEALFQQAFAARLAERKDALAALVGQEQSLIQLEKAAARARILSARASLRSRPRLARLPAIAALWRDGAYPGTAAAAKDLLIARQRSERPVP